MASSSQISTDDGQRPQSPQKSVTPKVRVVAELFQDYNEFGYKQALNELDTALVENCEFIVIEPQRLGDETARWIAVGNFVHKSCVISGLGAILASLVAPDAKFFPIQTPCTILCLGFATVYTFSWQSDPCCNYQVETDKSILASIQLDSQPISCGSCVVLRRRDHKRRVILHLGVAFLASVAFGFGVWRRW